MATTSGHGRIERSRRAGVGISIGGLAGAVPMAREAVDVVLGLADVPQWLADLVSSGGWDQLVALATLAAGVVGIWAGVAELRRVVRRRSAH